MFKKLTLTFVVSLVVFSFLLKSFFNWQEIRQDQSNAKKTQIIQENVKDRFKLSLALPQSVGSIAANYFSHSNLLTKDYGPFIKELKEISTEIIGLNLVNPSGVIVRAFPAESNPNIVGKTTQNIERLNESLEKKESFWLSPPFNLYQGQKGFALYSTIYEGKKFKGWAAVVIDSELFFKKFSLERYTESYHLVIKDQGSDLNYFATGLIPSSDINTYQSEMNFNNRKIVLQSWRKKQQVDYNISTVWIVAIAGVFSGVMSLIMWLHEHRKKAREKLEDISYILQLSSKEVLSSLIDSQDSQPDNQTSLSNLIEQIDLLQTMAYTGNDIEYKSVHFMTMLKKQEENIKDILMKKNLTLNYESAGVNDVYIFGNPWLLQSSVIAYILIHSVIHAQKGSNVKIKHVKNNQSLSITFTTNKTQPLSNEQSEVRLARRLEVARRIIQMHDGHFAINKDSTGGLIIRIQLPVEA